MSIQRILVAVAGPMTFSFALWVPTCPAHAQAFVEIDVAGLFTTFATGAAGVGSETEVIEQKVIDGGGQEIIRKIPGRLKYLDITLERGITNNLDLANWRELVEDGDIASARADIIVKAIDATMDPIATWNGTACWPSRIENLVPDPASDAGAVVEKLVIVCEGLVRTE